MKKMIFLSMFIIFFPPVLYGESQIRWTKERKPTSYWGNSVIPKVKKNKKLDELVKLNSIANNINSNTESILESGRANNETTEDIRLLLMGIDELLLRIEEKLDKTQKGSDQEQLICKKTDFIRQFSYSNTPVVQPMDCRRSSQPITRLNFERMSLQDVFEAGWRIEVMASTYVVFERRDY